MNSPVQNNLKRNIYFKSFARRNEKLEISTFDPNSKTKFTCQTLEGVLEDRLMKPNTRHPLLNDRLSVSLPTLGFTGQYRPEGILFTTESIPSYCSPFDLMALTYGQTFTFKDYGSGFLPGYGNFVFQNYEEMLRHFPTSKKAIESLNGFRTSHGLAPFAGTAYNELCFESEIRVEPVALVGNSEEIRRLSDFYRISRHASVNDYIIEASSAARAPREIAALALVSCIILAGCIYVSVKGSSIFGEALLDANKMYCTFPLFK